MCSWEGEGVNEVGKEKETGILRVTINEKYFRPTEVVSSKKKKNNFENKIDGFRFVSKELLIGNPKKAEEKLKWKPKIKFSVCYEHLFH